MTTRYVNTSSSGGDGTTNNESGGTAAYVSLASFVSNELPVTASDAWVVYCDSGTSNNADTATVTITGFSGSSSNTLTIQPNSGQEHSGSYDTTVYRHSAAVNTSITVSDSYTTLKGIQVENARTGGATQRRGIQCASATTEMYIVDCIVTQLNDTTNTNSPPIQLNNTSMTLCGVINCLVYDWTCGGNHGGIEIRANSASPNQNFVYNCTVVDSTEGYRAAGGNALFKNCLAFNNTTNWQNSGGADTTNSTDNASDDTAATIFGSNSVDLSAYGGTDIFNDYTADDFTLGSGTGRAAIDDEGADLDADSYYAVTTDSIGTSRDASTPSIGWHEYVAVASATGKSNPINGPIGGPIAGPIGI